MQRQYRALRRHKVAAAFDDLGHAVDFVHRPLDVGLPFGLDHLEQAAAYHVDGSFQQMLQLRVGKIVALANLERQHAVLAGPLDQRGISDVRESGPGIAGGAPHHLAVAAADDDVGEIGRKFWPLRHRQQMALPLCARDFDQLRLIDHGRTAQQRACDHEVILARELADQHARRVGNV